MYTHNLTLHKSNLITQSACGCYKMGNLFFITGSDKKRGSFILLGIDHSAIYQYNLFTGENFSLKMAFMQITVSTM